MKLSIVIPIRNEESTLPDLYRAIYASIDPLGVSWEVVFVNDASSDESGARLNEISTADPQHAKVIVLRRNYGQTAAIAAGIDYAEGDLIVLMDGDFQNNPADIPIMLNKLNEGYDVVSGWRKDRKDGFWNRVLPSTIANYLISWVTGVHLHDYGCTLKLYRREILKGFQLYGEMHRFIPAYASSVGAKLTEIVVQHHPRKYGKSKIKLGRTFRVLLDLMTVKFLLSFSASPIYIFGGTGLVTIFLSALTLFLLAGRKIIWGISVLDSPFFQISILFFALGFQSILLGLIAELLIRTYHETLGKPTYTIRKTININTNPK